MTRLIRIAITVALLATGFTAAVGTMPAQSAQATAAAVTTSYTDPAGDVPAGVPDITDVSVTTPSSSEVDFSVMLGGATFGPGFFLDISLYPSGSSIAAYLLRLDGTRSVITAYDLRSGSAVAFTASLLEGTTSLTPEQIHVGLPDIGNPSSFDFKILAWSFDAAAAPACCYDETGLWHFDLAPAGSTATTTTTTTAGSRPRPPAGPPNVTPPSTGIPGIPKPTGGTTTTTATNPAGPTTTSTTPATPATPATAALYRFAVAPASHPRAGRSFNLRISAGSQITRLACSASAAGRQLHTTITLHHAENATCSMRINHANRRQRLRVTVTARVAGKRLTTHYDARIS